MHAFTTYFVGDHAMGAVYTWAGRATSETEPPKLLVRLRQVFEHFRTVDATQSLDDVTRQVAKLIRDFHALKSGKRTRTLDVRAESRATS